MEEQSLLENRCTFDVRCLLAENQREVYVSLYVEICDKGTPVQTGTGTLIVHLMDVNDNFPEFAMDYRPVVYENRPPGRTVIEISAEDRDTRSNGPPFEFWLPCGGGCPCTENPLCEDFSFKFVPGMCHCF